MLKQFQLFKKFKETLAKLKINISQLAQINNSIKELKDLKMILPLILIIINTDWFHNLLLFLYDYP